jgi:hypothetical protein
MEAAMMISPCVREIVNTNGDWIRQPFYGFANCPSKQWRKRKTQEPELLGLA